ncbi:putative membrane protein [cyanobiont of Ornithocercus magnificus]|nr:putative membrane protein [cyanobiont of Ornithocercus magnificus]
MVIASISSAELANLTEDLRLGDAIPNFPTLPQPPYLLAGLGLVIAIICGFTFSRLIQDRLDKWKQDRLTMLPLKSTETSLSYAGILLGVTLFIGGSLQVFGFVPGAAILVSLLLSLATGGALWAQLEGLMHQVESGNFRAVDFDNFDEFF